MSLSLRLAAIGIGLSVSTLGFAEMPTRSGLYLSGGLGLQSTSFEGEQNGKIIGSEVNFGALTTLKAGYYIQPKVTVYGLSNAAWWWDSEGDSYVTVGLLGMGSTFYFRDYLGPYVEIGVGFSYLRDLKRSNESNGGAYSFGFGAEVRPNIQFGVVYQVSRTEEILSNATSSLKEKFRSNSLALKLEFKL